MTDEPSDVAAEQAVLGSMMLSGDRVPEVCAVIDAADYYRPQHQVLHEVITDMHAKGSPVDPVSVLDELARRGKVRAGALDGPYLHTLMQAAMPGAAAHHSRIVRRRADERALLILSAQLKQGVESGTDPAVLRTRMMGALTARQVDEQPHGAHLAPIPAYPVDALCGPLLELVTSGRSAGLQPALVGGAGLAALGIVSGTADLHISDTWTERGVIWVPLVAPRGAGKTPAQGFAFRELRRLNAEQHRLHSDELSMWLEKAPKDRDARPADPTLLIDDATLEMTARWLGQGSGTGGIDADELSGWLKRMGRYTASGDGGERGRWLSLWSAQPWRYQRVGSNIDILIPRPVLSICGGIQPPLHHLLGGEEDGLRPRWLPHLAALDASTSPAAGCAAPGWDKVISDLFGNREPRTWTLEGDAYNEWSAARARWKRESASGRETASASAALAKADVQAARIALVLAESLDPGAGDALPFAATAAAIALTDYVLDCWRAMPDREALTTSRRDETLHRGVDQLADWLEQHGGRATARDLQRAHVAGVRTADELKALTARYEAEYPGSTRTEQPQGGGRPGQVVYAPRRGLHE